MNTKSRVVLVTGATGNQGGGVARALLRSGHRVRAFVRDPGSAPAGTLATAGCEIEIGAFEDEERPAAALEGVDAVFSVQRPDLDNSNSERRHGFALVDAARHAGVRHFIHSSVCQLDDHERFPRWNEGYWSVSYWTDKQAVEDRINAAGFDAVTILRPSFIMENFCRGKAQVLFPQLKGGVLVTPILPGSLVQLIAADDIGAFAAAAVADPASYAGEVIELAGDALKIDEIAAILSEVTHSTIKARSVPAEDAIAAGLPAGWVRSQEWINDVGYHVDEAQLSKYPVALTSFRAWATAHRDALLAP